MSQRIAPIMARSSVGDVFADSCLAKEPVESNGALLLQAGAKLSGGGAHISRTMMLDELQTLLGAVPDGAPIESYREAIVGLNVLAKRTTTTRDKSLRHLRELYALSKDVPLFAALRHLYTVDPGALPLLALLCAWSRDPLLRATTSAVLPVPDSSEVKTSTLADAIAGASPGHYSELSQKRAARNAASTWSQSGHLVGRVIKKRRRVLATAGPVTMALWLGNTAGFHGAACFSSPWCRLLDLDPSQARSKAFEAHRVGLLTVRAVGEIVELSFPGMPSLSGGTV